MKNPSLKARPPTLTETTPDIEKMHARITAREDRSTWKRLNIRLPEELLDALKVSAMRTKPKTTAENIAIELLAEFVAAYPDGRKIE